MKTNYYNGITLGPLLKEDAAFLQAIIEMTNPKMLVEFGYFSGHSARAMLDVMSADAELHSFDNSRSPTLEDKRFHFHHKSQEEIEGINNIDFVFLDASHDFVLNQKTFLKIKDCLSEKAIIAVHDTGTWIGGNVFNCDFGYKNLKDEWVHCADERRFMNWIRQEFPEFQQIHFHSSREVRHGITLLQKYCPLNLE